MQIRPTYVGAWGMFKAMHFIGLIYGLNCEKNPSLKICTEYTSAKSMKGNVFYSMVEQ